MSLGGRVLALYTRSWVITPGTERRRPRRKEDGKGEEEEEVKKYY